MHLSLSKKVLDTQLLLMYINVQIAVIENAQLLIISKYKTMFELFVFLSALYEDCSFAWFPPKELLAITPIFCEVSFFNF